MHHRYLVLFGLNIISYRQLQKFICTHPISVWTVQNTLCMRKADSLGASEAVILLDHWAVSLNSVLEQGDKRAPLLYSPVFSTCDALYNRNSHTKDGCNMNEAPEDKINEHKYRLISVEKIDPPEGMPSGSWYRYVIGQGTSRIEGKRLGTLKAVTRHAEEYAENLDTRSTIGYSAYVSRKQKK